MKLNKEQLYHDMFVCARTEGNKYFLLLDYTQDVYGEHGHPNEFFEMYKEASAAAEAFMNKGITKDGSNSIWISNPYKQ
jgi:hypothetical protein